MWPFGPGHFLLCFLLFRYEAELREIHFLQAEMARMQRDERAQDRRDRERMKQDRKNEKARRKDLKLKVRADKAEAARRKAEAAEEARLAAMESSDGSDLDPEEVRSPPFGLKMAVTCAAVDFRRVLQRCAHPATATPASPMLHSCFTPARSRPARPSGS